MWVEGHGIKRWDKKDQGVRMLLYRAWDLGFSKIHGHLETTFYKGRTTGWFLVNIYKYSDAQGIQQSIFAHFDFEIFWRSNEWMPNLVSNLFCCFKPGKRARLICWSLVNPTVFHLRNVLTSMQIEVEFSTRLSCCNSMIISCSYSLYPLSGPIPDTSWENVIFTT